MFGECIIYISSVNFVFEYQIKNTVELCLSYLQLTTTAILEQLTKPAIRFIGIETNKEFIQSTFYIMLKASYRKR